MAAASLSACAQTLDATHLGVPATLAAPADAPPQGNEFHFQTHSTYAFWGALSLSQASLEKALASQLAGGKGVANVKVRIRSRFTDVLITGLTLGLIVPRTVTFEGVVVDK
jgi:hypothetical protein